MTLEKKRLEYKPLMPEVLKDLNHINIERGKATGSIKDEDELKKIFPLSFGRPIINFVKGPIRPSRVLRVGVLFSGGQAAGGHNVIAGLFDGLKRLNGQNQLLGFLGGPSGVLDSKYIEITEELISKYRNLGGFDLLGSGRTKIETDEQLMSALNCVRALNLDGLVIIGGDDSNTNAALIAEYFQKMKYPTTVVGVPKTIDGDLRGEYLEITFGFDTATKVYSEMIGNILKDAISAKKYYHFIKLMGRSASHVTLECAMKTHPNLVIIGEEVEKEKKRLSQIVTEIADLIEKREKNYGVILIPEGLIEFIGEIKLLISELNSQKPLTPQAKKTLSELPEKIASQLTLERDPHGNVQVSLIETEKLLIDLVANELKKRNYKGKFNAISHFLGYEGRAAFPSNFDANYTYSLGALASLLVFEKLTGYMAVVNNLKEEVNKWVIRAIPITMLMNMEMRKNKLKPVIQKGLVDLNGKTFKEFVRMRKNYEISDSYQSPGPIQFFGDPAITDSVPLTMGDSL